jgi:hypothetical protein
MLLTESVIVNVISQKYLQFPVKYQKTPTIMYGIRKKYLTLCRNCINENI